MRKFANKLFLKINLTLIFKCNALELENKAILDLIKILKFKVSSLEAGKHQTENKPAVTQTEYDDEFVLEFPCKECTFQASCEDELMCHISNEHDKDETVYNFSCYICEHKTATKGELMTHRKAKHPETAKVCRNFEKRMFDFDKKKLLVES